MGLFVSAANQVAHGTFALEVPPPASVSPTGFGVAVDVAQFPWGPSEKLNYVAGTGDFVSTYAPAGMARTGSGYLSVLRKAFPVLGVVRVADPTAVAASGKLDNLTPTHLITLTAKYTGSAGNSIVATVGAASDGNSNHFNLTVAVSSGSGTTSEVYPNLNVSGSGADVLPDLSKSLLLASAVKTASGIPAPGNVTLGSGTDGSITSQLYVGTPGGDDDGFALLEGDNTIRHVFTDDPGNSLRANVGAGLLAHVDLTTDRIGYWNGPSGQTTSQAIADVANFRSERMCYVDPWAFVADDVDGTLHLVPGAPWAASVASQLSPSTSIAWKADFISAMLDGISALEFNRNSSSTRQLNDVAQITTLITRATGGHAFEAGLNTSETPGVGDLTRTNMLIFIASSVKEAWEPFVDAPSTVFYQQDLINSLDVFLGSLKANSKNENAAFTPYILDYAIKSIASSNTPTSLANDNFTVAADVQTGSQMSRIYLSLNAGPTVTISAT
jgi:uncharacterized protein